MSVGGCWTPEGTLIHETATFDGPGTCNQLYPSGETTRMAAGGPPSEDVLKCRLRPVDPRDYPGELTREDRARLREVFPQGVCDFRRPGIGRQRLAEVWRDFSRG